MLPDNADHYPPDPRGTRLADGSTDLLSAPEVIVAGLGAMGSAVAWQLAARGWKVTGFDRFHPPHSLGSSGGRSRIIREAYWESPFYVPIVRRSIALWVELEQRTGRHLLRRTGGLVIGPPGGPLVSGAVASAEEHGVPFRLVSASQVRERYPFRPGDDLMAVWEERAGVLGPEACITAMLTEAARMGADFRFDEPVTEWRSTAGGVEVRTGTGQFRADCLVLAAGAWMAGGLPRLSLPLRVTRQTMFWLRPGSDQALFTPERCPIWLWETPDGLMFYGFPDLGDGPKVARHHGGPPVNPETVDRHVHREEAAEVLGFLAGAIPALAGMVTDARVCLYTNTPDEHFILDRHPDHRTVLLASPCSGHGFKFVPALAEAAADLLEERGAGCDLTPFRQARFMEHQV